MACPVPVPAAPMSHTVLLVDDHPMTRAGLRQVVESALGLTACGEASRLAEALAAVERLRPDLVVADVELGRESGLDLAKQLQMWDAAPPVLMVSMHAPQLYASRALAAGARGYLCKDSDESEILRAIRTVLRGGVYLGRGVDVEAPMAFPDLSDRETEVFLLLGRGYAPRHIAETLGLSVSTVEAHRERLKLKLGVPDSAHLVRYAVAWAVDHARGVGLRDVAVGAED